MLHFFNGKYGMLKTVCGTTVVQAKPQWIQHAVMEQMAAAGHSHVSHHRPTPTLGEPLWIPCRLFLCYKRCSHSQWNQPMERDISYHLGYLTVIVHVLLQSGSTSRFTSLFTTKWCTIHSTGRSTCLGLCAAHAKSTTSIFFFFFFNIFHSMHNDSTVTM